MNLNINIRKNNKGKIKILGKEFIKNNKDKIKIIYNKCELELKEYFEIIEKDDKDIL